MKWNNVTQSTLNKIFFPYTYNSASDTIEYKITNAELTLICEMFLPKGRFLNYLFL